MTVERAIDARSGKRGRYDARRDQFLGHVGGSAVTEAAASVDWRQDMVPPRCTWRVKAVIELSLRLRWRLPSGCRAAICSGDISRVPPHAGRHRRGHGMLEQQAAEVEAGDLFDDAAAFPGPPVLPEDRQVDPAEVGRTSGAPHHGRHVEDRVVGEHGPSVLNRHGGRLEPGDPAACSVLRPDPADRDAVPTEVALHPTADRGAPGQQVAGEEDEDGTNALCARDPGRNGSWPG